MKVGWLVVRNQPSHSCLRSRHTAGSGITACNAGAGVKRIERATGLVD